jgi:hypothetical protein
VGAERELVAPVASAAWTVSGAIVEPPGGNAAARAAPDSAEPATPRLSSAPNLGGPDTTGADQERPDDSPVLEGPASSDLTPTVSSERRSSSPSADVADAGAVTTMLTFDRPSPDEPSAESGAEPTAESASQSSGESAASAEKILAARHLK